MIINSIVSGQNYDQGAHYRGKSGKTGREFCEKKFPAGKNQGILEKWLKSGNLEKTCPGNIREFSAIYIYIYNIYISWKMGKLSGKNQGICFTKLSGHPV